MEKKFIQPLELYKLLEEFKEFIGSDIALEIPERIELSLRVDDLQESLEKIAKKRSCCCDKEDEMDELDAKRLKDIYHDKSVCVTVRQKASDLLRKRFHQDDH